MMTTAGSLALAGVDAADGRVHRRSGCATAGAVILGKTNLSEWANFRSTHSSSGWSGRGGQTPQSVRARPQPVGLELRARAPRSPRTWRAAAVGTETDGSIVSPSNNDALVGIKPTLGLVSRTGIIPIAHSQDTAGPDGAHGRRRGGRCSRALAGVRSADDAATDDATRRAARDYTTSLDANGLQGARIGVVRNRLFGYSPPPIALAEAAIADMKRQGAVIVDPANIPTLGKFDDSEFEVLLYEFKADLNEYLAWLGPGRAGALACTTSSRSTTRTRTRRCRTSARRS